MVIPLIRCSFRNASNGMITTLFSDVRGFTSFSESVAPEQLVSILNQYLAAAAEAILVHEGTVDKFMGDAVMAWFNAPIPQADHTLRAVKAALLMRQTIEELHKELSPEFQLGFGTAPAGAFTYHAEQSVAVDLILFSRQLC